MGSVVWTDVRMAMQFLLCQFQSRIDWSSDAEMIHGYSWWKKTVRT